MEILKRVPPKVSPSNKGCLTDPVLLAPLLDRRGRTDEGIYPGLFVCEVILCSVTVHFRSDPYAETVSVFMGFDGLKRDF